MSLVAPRVAFLLRTFSLGGAELQALREANALAELGVSVVVIARVGSWAATGARRAGLSCCELRAGPIPLRALDGVDVVHVHEPKDLPWALLAARRRSLPVVLTRHLAASARRRRDPYHRWLRRRIRWVVSSAFVRDSMVAAYGVAPDAVRVVPYGYAAPPLSPGWEAARALRATATIGMLSRLSHGKHLADAVAVLKHVRRAGRDAALWIAGEETDCGARRELLRLAAERGLGEHVHLLGFRRDIASLLASFDVLLHTAHAESFGLAILEAMAHGCPVVASAGGGVPEVLSHEATGLLAPPGDVAALAGHVSRSLDDRPSAVGRAALARAQVIARFSPRAEAEALCRVYGEALAGDASSGKRARIATS